MVMSFKSILIMITQMVAIKILWSVSKGGLIKLSSAEAILKTKKDDRLGLPQPPNVNRKLVNRKKACLGISLGRKLSSFKSCKHINDGGNKAVNNRLGDILSQTQKGWGNLTSKIRVQFQEYKWKRCGHF